MKGDLEKIFTEIFATSIKVKLVFLNKILFLQNFISQSFCEILVEYVIFLIRFFEFSSLQIYFTGNPVIKLSQPFDEVNTLKFEYRII